MQNEDQQTWSQYPGSVLLSDRICDLVRKGLLIVDGTFDERNLRTAKYDARLGKTYYKDGEYHTLDDERRILRIAPYELVFVESHEVFSLPENLVGQYDIRISGCLGGIGLQTGLQLDPTYYGRIFCPLFNFSDKTLPLRYKEHLASIQFSYTTAPTLDVKSFASERQGLLSLNQALPDEPGRSGLAELGKSIEETQRQLQRRIRDFDSTAARLHTRVDSMIGAVFQGMAFMIAALGVLVAAVTMMVTIDTPLAPKTTLLIGVGIVAAIALIGFRRMKDGIGRTKKDE